MVLTIQRFSPDTVKVLLCLAITALILITPSLAAAAGAGGGMPWNAWLDRLTVALIATGAALIIIGLFIFGATLIFSHDWGRFGSSLVVIIIAGAFLTAGGVIMGNLGIAGAGV